MRSIELRGVTKRFGDVTALSGLDLRVEAGESIVVLGPSGCGKSTLLRLIAGLEDPTDGEIRFDDESQAGIPPHGRDVGIVFQHFALYPHLSTRDNITLGLRHGLGLSKTEAGLRADAITAKLEISELLDRKPRDMSGGQRQRVALARALARMSGFVLLDEPLSGLDAQLRSVLRVEIAALIRSTGATVFHVTHDQQDAMTMADRVVVMRDGRVEQVGTPEEVYSRPAGLFVARFIGTPPMNLFELDAGHPLVIAEPDVRRLPSGVTLGVRPEDLRLGGDGPVSLEATVVATELNGADWTVYVSSGDKMVSARTAVPPPPIGREITLTTDLAACHLFGPNGRRLDTIAPSDITPGR